jgi:hypothetical protein
MQYFQNRLSSIYGEGVRVKVKMDAQDEVIQFTNCVILR